MKTRIEFCNIQGGKWFVDFWVNSCGGCWKNSRSFRTKIEAIEHARVISEVSL